MPVVLPGPRDARGVLDGPDDGESVVVTCPPHPQQGGRRTDQRLRAVSDALADRGVACLRFDYGPWDEGRGERRDAANALTWASDRFERVALFGYSFGACVALAVAAGDLPESGPDAVTNLPPLAAVSALAPTAAIHGKDAVAAVDAIDSPLQVVCGERDDVADCAPVADRAQECGHAVESLPADHHFVVGTDRVAGLVAPFLVDTLHNAQ